ncbi:MAG TPA: alpha-amylase family glycosyl hydrolase [Chloroflexia bacterium]|nr:alpha-amylase family glycosyl hydrolase [Chloroflexia bacterium]
MTPPSMLTSVHHDGSRLYVSNPCPRFGETVQLRVRLDAAVPVRTIALRTLPDGEQHWTPMTISTQDAGCQWWDVELSVTMPLVTYRFVLHTDVGVWTLNGTGLHAHTPTDHDDFRLIADYEPSAWVRGSVFYQIFPDRFADGDPTSNVQTGEWHYRGKPVVARAWDTLPSHEHASLEFYGGDLAGIQQRLSYLTDLGVNALYLTPIFRAPSVHRYDVTDFEEVDAHLGGNAALVALRGALDAQQMRLLLDIVPNHCGVAHPWFVEAQADPTSPYREYFIWTSGPDEYVGWLGVRTLPKLNYRSAALREYMYAGPQSIFRRWMRLPFAIDGWRVDVANMIGQYRQTRLGGEVTRGIRAAVKAENPQAYLIGENFFDATEQLQGDQYDGNMNYRGFTVPLWEWLYPQPLPAAGFGNGVLRERLTTADLVATWAAFRAPIPYTIALQQFNLVDSHDTARIHTLAGGRRGLHQLAAAIQLTYPGVPCIYYGDEVGLAAADSIEARRTMPWDEAGWDHALRVDYQHLIALRRSSPALAEGGFQVLHIGPDTLAYLRDAGSERVILVAYRGEAERAAESLPVADGAIPDGTRFREVLTGAEARVSGGCLPLPAMQQGVFVWQSMGLSAPAVV